MESEDKKIEWTKPVLKKMGKPEVVIGQTDCADGTSAADRCQIGTSASGECSGGSTPGICAAPGSGVA